MTFIRKFKFSLVNESKIKKTLGKFSIIQSMRLSTVQGNIAYILRAFCTINNILQKLNPSLNAAEMWHFEHLSSLYILYSLSFCPIGGSKISLNFRLNMKKFPCSERWSAQLPLESGR